MLSSFLASGEMPDSLSDFTVDIKVANGAGSIKIMRAGTAPEGDYWRSLSRISWYDILYGDKPIGVPFFLELKERIQSTFAPDFLLIDARTGITEMGGIIQSAVSRLLDDPEGAQSDLEALTTYCADQEAYRALLKLYKVRKVGIDKLLATASLMWQLAGSKSGVDDLHIDIVTQAYAEQQRAVDSQRKFAEFAEAVWRSTGMSDIRIGLSIVNSFLPERKPQALQLLMDYVSSASTPSYLAVVRLIELLAASRDFAAATSIVDRFKGTLNAPQFDLAWAKLVLDQKDLEAGFELLNDVAFAFEAVRLMEPTVAYRLLKLVGDEDAADVLNESLELSLSDDDLSQIRKIGEVYQDEGRWLEFEKRLQGRLSGSAIAEINDFVKRRIRRPRPALLRA
ncbi:hypothetical protein [Tardiphaga robiniae]|uniref:Tetratricopeptide repeat protein n=1 Tax=Tardiphaga robiniae TaxID=943830 RepID=A0A161SQI1_9BRAD|nr:hypothetical protein [Tardiphaga robiniae]KZD23232.1 hypothetical protein A4A58_07570 [Tardiphaga robiniae]